MRAIFVIYRYIYTVATQGPQKHKKLIFSKNPNSVICPNIGGSFHSGPGDPGTIGPLETIHLT